MNIMTEQRRKKVLYLITKSNWGGAQRYVYDLATTIDKEVFEPVVALGGDGILKEMLEHAHIRTISISSLQRDVSVKKELAFIKELRKIIKQEKPDVLHVNSSKAGVVGTLVGRVMRVPRIIFTAHGWAFNENRSIWQKIVFKCFHWFTVLLSHKTIAVSTAIPKQLRWPLIEKKFIVINPGRTIGPMYGKREAREKVCEVLPALQAQLHKKWIVTVAELHPIKRQDVLVDAMKKITEKQPDAIAVLIGGGETRPALEQLIKENNVTNSVFLTGAITEAARFLKAADVFTLTSDSESYGYVIHEAGIAGVPVVVTRVGGVTDIVANEAEGLLMNRGDVDQLSEKVLFTLQDRNLAEKRAAILKAKLLTRTTEKMSLATTAVYELAL